MPTYDVFDRCIVIGCAEVEAKNLKEAREKARQGIEFQYETGDCYITVKRQKAPDPAPRADAGSEESL